MPAVPKRARSRAGRTRGKARYRAKQRRLSSATSTKGDRGQPVSYWDSLSPSSDWQEIADRTVNFPHKEVPLVDGSGLPTPEQWDPSAYNFEMASDPETTRLLSDGVFEAARSWACKPEVSKFLQSFQRADEKKRMELQGQWVKLGLEEAAANLSLDLASVLSQQGYGEIATLLEQATSRSPLKGRLLEAIVRASGKKGQPEDTYGAVGVMGGVAIGIEKIMTENDQCWPPFSPKPLRKGEPADLVEWDGEDAVCPVKLRPELTELSLAKIDQELGEGRMERITVEEAKRRGARVVTPMTSIFKDRKHTKQSEKEKTPDWQEIPEDLRFKSPTALQYDIQGAYRLLDTDQAEQKWLVVSDLGSVEASPTVLYNAAVHRAQRRLVGGRQGGRDLCYIDDSVWRVADWVEAISLLLLPLAMGLSLEYSKLERGTAALAVPAAKREDIREVIESTQASGWVDREVLKHKPWLSALYALAATMDKKQLRRVKLG
ncbi:hypothetical protein FOZ63_026074, partial [Perkinsus olseni]